MGKCVGLMYSILNDQVYTFLCDSYFNMKKKLFLLIKHLCTVHYMYWKVNVSFENCNVTNEGPGP